MSSFSETNLNEKFSQLNASQQSIQTLSLWLIHHRKHSKTIVFNWVKALRKAKPNKKLPFLYLANDVIQNSRKKGEEFNRDFRLVLCDAYRHATKYVDGKSRKSMERVLSIWKERAVFDAEMIEKVRNAMKESSATSGEQKTDSPSVTAAMKKTSLSRGAEEQASKSRRHVEKREERKDAKKRKKPELSLKEELEQEFANGPGEPPEPEVLVKCLQELENSASSDAVVREQIAALPAEVSDIKKLDDLKDQGDALELRKTVDEAVSLLTSYNSRLSSELGDRKKVAKMLRDYIAAQKSALTESEAKLEEYKGKLQKVDEVRHELRAHMTSLPDLTQLPDVGDGLSPLPSATDLFTGK